MTILVRCLTCCALVAILPAELLSQESSGASSFGVRAGWGLSAAPHGAIAERHGTFVVPGRDHEVGFHFRSADGRELSLSVLSDGYGITQQLDSQVGSRFEYSSTGLFAGFTVTDHYVGSVPMRLGVDAGWRWYSVESDRPDYYTSEPAESGMKGRAAAVGLSAGIEVPFEFAAAVPRVRIETSYPTFSGGDGYTAMRQVRELAFRASLGVALKYDFTKAK